MFFLFIGIPVFNILSFLWDILIIWRALRSGSYNFNYGSQSVNYFSFADLDNLALRDLIYVIHLEYTQSSLGNSKRVRDASM